MQKYLQCYSSQEIGHVIILEDQRQHKNIKGRAKNDRIWNLYNTSEDFSGIIHHSGSETDNHKFE